MFPRSSSALNTNSSILHQASSQESIYEQAAAKIVNPRQIVGGRGGQAVSLLTFYGGSQQRVVPPLNIGGGHKGGVPGLKEWDNKGGAEVYTNRTETLLRQTAYAGSANAAKKLFQEKRPKDQVLISINCSRAVPHERSLHLENAQVFNSKNNETTAVTLANALSKTPQLASSSVAKKGSLYHINCSNGSSMIQAPPPQPASAMKTHYQFSIPTLQHKKNMSTFCNTNNPNNNSNFINRVDSYNNYNKTGGTMRSSSMCIQQNAGQDLSTYYGGRRQFGSNAQQTGGAATDMTYRTASQGHLQMRQFSLPNQENINTSPTNRTHQGASGPYWTGKGAEKNKSIEINNHGDGPRTETIQYGGTKQTPDYHEHYSTQTVDFDQLFPKPESKQKKAVMYNRALRSLKTILQNKGLKDSAAVLQNTNYGLIHFHIDGDENTIQLNKYDTRSSTSQALANPVGSSNPLLNPKRFMLQPSILNLKHGSELTTLKSVSSNNGQSASNLIIPPSKIQQSKIALLNKSLQDDNETSFDYETLHLPKVENIEEVENDIENLATEDFVSSQLMKDSPVMRQKQKATEQFMMQIRATASIQEDGQSQMSNYQSAREEQKKQQRTILFTKEVNDIDPDYINMEIKEFVHLNEEQLAKAYNVLQKSITAVFSGSVNTLINKLDLKRAVEDMAPYLKKKKKKGHFKKKSELNQIESGLLEELKSCKEQLARQKMIYGMWTLLNTSGSLPHSREGSAGCIIDSQLFIFGGFSRDLFGDFRVFDLHQNQWRIIPSQPLLTPCARYSHTMLPYDKKLVVFGGAGGYLPAIKMRMSYNDVHIYDTEEETWLKEPEIEGAPSKRMSHCASIFGGMMVVHGGYNTEQKKILRDFGIFDLENQVWLLNKVYKQEADGHFVRIDDQHFPYDQTDPSVIGFRHMHSMNAIFDSEYYEDRYPKSRHKQRRAMWLKKRVFSGEDQAKGLSFEEGFYLFGGVDQKGHTYNDLWLIQPHIEENELVLSQNSLDFLPRVKHQLSLKIKRVTNYSGKAPCPRIMHATTVFKDWNKHRLLVIYGGRNDQIYQRTSNVALNDICIFNVHKLEWTTLAMYGEMPCSRWSHCFTINRGYQSGSVDGFLVFGGVNLTNYCKSRVYQFQILNKWYVPKGAAAAQDGAIEEIDEKLQMMISSVKQKTELAKELLKGKYELQHS